MTRVQNQILTQISRLKGTSVISILLFAALLSGCIIQNTKWNFVGYQYRWSEDYVERKDFETESECTAFGENWLKKQESDEALYTCSLGCKSDDVFPGAEVCKKVCEYGKEGFIKCRE